MSDKEGLSINVCEQRQPFFSNTSLKIVNVSMLFILLFSHLFLIQIFKL